MASIISLAGTGNAPLDMAAIPKNVPLNITFALDDGQIVINSAIGRLNLPVYAFLTTSNDAEGYTYFAAGQTEWGEPQYIAVPIDQTIQELGTDTFYAQLDENVGLWAVSGATFGALLSPTVTITGSSEADTLTGGSGGSSIDPGGGVDTVNGGEAGDVIYIATYDLNIDGEADHLNGNGGNDVFIGFDPADFVDGGEGYDVIRHSGTWSNIMPDGNWQDWGDPTTWHVSGIEAYETTDYVSAMPLLAGEGLADTTFGYIGGVTSAQLEFFSALRLAPDVIAEGANHLAIDILGLVEVDLSDQLGTLSVFIESSGGEQDADIIETGDGDDVLWGWFGDDTLVGNGGNDWFSSFGAVVHIDGGDGIDRLSQFGAMGHGFNTLISGWTITGVEVLETAGKRIYGTASQFNGFETIVIGGTLEQRTALGVTSEDRIMIGITGPANEIDFRQKVTSPGGVDVQGSSGVDKIIGTEFGDTFYGGGNNDVLDGDAGNDILEGGPGGDELKGGAGFDVVGYKSATSGIGLKLGTEGSSFGLAAGDKITDVELVVATAFSDKISVGSGASKFSAYGNGGDDEIWGSVANDFLYGDFHEGSLTGLLFLVPLASAAGLGTATSPNDGGSDQLHGGDGTDTLFGGGGNDFLGGGLNADTLHGGEGNDTLGSDGTTPVGNSEKTGGNKLLGGGGNDVLYSNTLDTGQGDTLTGDGDGTLTPGSDTFWVNNNDIITDFSKFDQIVVAGNYKIDVVTAFFDGNYTKINYFTEISDGSFKRDVSLKLEGKFDVASFRIKSGFDGYAAILQYGTPTGKLDTSLSTFIAENAVAIQSQYNKALAELTYDSVLTAGAIDIIETLTAKLGELTLDKFLKTFGEHAVGLFKKVLGAFVPTLAKHLAGEFDHKTSAEIVTEYGKSLSGLVFNLKGGFVAGFISDGVASIGKEIVSSMIDWYFDSLWKEMAARLPGDAVIYRRLKTGDDQANSLKGSKDSDRLVGLGGNDKLDGKGSDDLLSGGPGKDSFIFSTKLAASDVALNTASNIDHIVDFDSKDKIALGKKVFKGLDPGKLAKSDFVQFETKLKTKSAAIAYDTKGGGLYFDSDGKGAKAPILFAIVDGAPSLKAGDFVVFG